MAKALVIVESPAKAKTINKYLGKDFIVKASLGHIKDLPKRDLAVDVEHGFEPRYEVIEGKKKLVAELKQAAKKVQDVYLAADPDREGEAICFHLQEELSEKKNGPRIYRVMFNEITKKAIAKAFEKPGQVDVNLVDAQQARRVLDRLVGYKISPLLWDKVRRGLSAGRVQTVALRVIVEREREIRAFVAREYWTIDADLAAKKPPAAGGAPDAHQRPDRRNRLDRGRQRRGGGARRRRVHGAVGFHAREAAFPGGAVHHFHLAAGIVAQAALQREAHHDAGAAAVRRRGGGQRHGRPHHLHAHGFDARFR